VKRGAAGALATAVVFVVATCATTAGAAAPRWTVVPTAAGTAYGHLAAVSCPAPTACVAVGTQDSSGTGVKLIERWNGQKWVGQLSPTPSGARSSSLAAVKCSSSAFCIAVGQYSTSTVTKTLALRWSANRWSLLPTPNAVSAVNVLSGLACSSATNCFAVGSYFMDTGTIGGQTTLIERWDGKSWTIVPSPNVADAFDSGLVGAACASSADCLAVGSSHTETLNDTLAEHWDGAAWSIVASPDPPNSSDNELAAIACPSATACLAVGSSDHGTLAERWNGTSWSLAPSKNPLGATGGSLVSISCPVVTRCTAAGVVFKSNNQQRLVEVLTPQGASVVGVPVPSDTKRSSLSGVSCATVTSCFAVGDYARGPSRRPLLLRYS
jgi:hypothetical protein